MNSGIFDFKRVLRRFRRPLVTGAGTVEVVERILLRTQTATEVGYGEIAPWPGFPSENIPTALEILRAAQGNLSRLGASVAATSAYPCLAAALSSCRYWTAIAAYNRSLPCAGLSSQNPQEISAKLASGFRTLKIKITASTPLATMHAVLRSFDGTIRLDANGALDLATARAWVDFVRQESRIEFIEQPLAVGHAGYTSLGPEKVALDESFLTPAGLTWKGPVVVKPMLVGDWDAFLAWRKADPQRAVTYSSCFETAIGRQGALWLSAQDTRASAIGFDTLGRFEMDGRDRHTPGPRAQGAADINWSAFWAELT